MIREHFAENEGAKLHYLSSGDSAELTPLIYLPGFGSDAESFRDEMRYFSPRRTIGVGKRGLGKSSITESGYSFETQVSDLTAVIDDAKPSKFCLMAFSMAVPIALKYSVKHSNRLKGMLLLDYRARYPKLPQEWAEKTVQSSNLPVKYIFGSRRESKEVELWDELAAVVCPVLIVRGGKSRALTVDEGERYLTSFPNSQQVVFEDSGHEVYKPDYERFIATIEFFLEQLDST